MISNLLATVLICTPHPPLPGNPSAVDWIASMILAPEEHILVVRIRDQKVKENILSFRIDFSHSSLPPFVSESSENGGKRLSFDLSKQVWVNHPQFEGSSLSFLLGGMDTKNPTLTDTQIEASIDSAQPIHPVTIPDSTCEFVL